MTSKYSREQRYEAAAAMVSYGNSLAVSDMVSIPASTLRHWHRNDHEFQSMMQEIWADYGAEIMASLAQIVRESGEQVLDRIRHGDVFRDPGTGESYRLPMRGKEIAVAGAIAFDKLALAQNRPTQIVSHRDSEAQLERLAEQFRALAQNSGGD